MQLPALKPAFSLFFLVLHEGPSLSQQLISISPQANRSRPANAPCGLRGGTQSFVPSGLEITSVSSYKGPATGLHAIGVVFLEALLNGFDELLPSGLWECCHV